MKTPVTSLLFKVFFLSILINCSLFENNLAQSISRTNLSDSSSRKIQTITQTFTTKYIGENSTGSSFVKQASISTKAKLKSGEIYNFDIDLGNTPHQVVHVKIKRPFRLPNLLKYVTPFAAATVVNKGFLATYQGRSDEFGKQNIGTGTNLAAGVVVTTGFLKRKKPLFFKSKLLITYFDKRGIRTSSKSFDIPDDNEVIVPMAYCGGEQTASIGIISTDNASARVSVDNQRSSSLSKEGDDTSVLDYGDPCEIGGPGRGLLSETIGFTSRNVEITWGNNFSNPVANSFFSGAVLGISFQQTSQTTTYNPSTGYFTYSIYGVQTYGLPFGPVQGGAYSVVVNIFGTYSPAANASTMVTNYQ